MLAHEITTKNSVREKNKIYATKNNSELQRIVICFGYGTNAADAMGYTSNMEAVCKSR
jgi:hypothetical protein